MVKNPHARTGDSSSIPGLGRSPGEGSGNPFQYSCLGNPMDGGAWQAGYSPWGWKQAGHDLAAKQQAIQVMWSVSQTAVISVPKIVFHRLLLRNSIRPLIKWIPAALSETSFQRTVQSFQVYTWHFSSPEAHSPLSTTLCLTGEAARTLSYLKRFQTGVPGAKWLNNYSVVPSEWLVIYPYFPAVLNLRQPWNFTKSFKFSFKIP